MKTIKELRNELNESKQEDIADLKALLKNPDPKVAKNYGGIEGYKKMLQSKIDKLMKEETELTENSQNDKITITSTDKIIQRQFDTWVYILKVSLKTGRWSLYERRKMLTPGRLSSLDRTIKPFETGTGGEKAGMVRLDAATVKLDESTELTEAKVNLRGLLNVVKTAKDDWKNIPGLDQEYDSFEDYLDTVKQRVRDFRKKNPSAKDRLDHLVKEETELTEAKHNTPDDKETQQYWMFAVMAPDYITKWNPEKTLLIWKGFGDYSRILKTAEDVLAEYAPYIDLIHLAKAGSNNNPIVLRTLGSVLDVPGTRSGLTVKRLSKGMKVVKLPPRNKLKEETELDEAMSRAARIKRSKIMKRLQPKIKKAKERAAKKKASSDVIDKRAEKQAKEVLIKKWLKGKSKSDVPFAERERIEGKLKKSKKAVDRIKKKLVKDIRKQEAGKLAKKESTELDENKRTIPDDYIDFMDDDKSWIAVKATNSGEDTVRGEIAKKNWPTGAPVTKTFAKGIAQIPDGEFWVIVAKKYWYWKQDNGKWAALPRKGATPPFDY